MKIVLDDGVSLTLRRCWCFPGVWGARAALRAVDRYAQELRGPERAAERCPGRIAGQMTRRSRTSKYERRPPGPNKDRGDTVIGEGLRFDADMPVETIDVPSPVLAGADAETWQVINYKITHHLAQRPGSWAVLA